MVIMYDAHKTKECLNHFSPHIFRFIDNWNLIVVLFRLSRWLPLLQKPGTSEEGCIDGMKGKTTI